MRHARAVERGTPGFTDDSVRPLTPEGEEKMYDIARGMRRLDLGFDLLLSSPFVRARRTAEIVAEVLDERDKLEFTDALAADGDPRELITELRARRKSPAALLLVGHEPYLSGLISTLIAGEVRLPLTLRKGGLAKLVVDSLTYGRCATLEWLLAPKQLVSIR